MKNRKGWDEYFLGIAQATAKRSTCLRVPDGVGAILVYRKNIVATGYAGSIKGLPHCTDEGVGCLMDPRTGGCVRTVHAEINALIHAGHNGQSIEDCTIYTTLSPCWDCFKALANGGVARIIYSKEYRDIVRQKDFAAQCKIEFLHVPLNLMQEVVVDAENIGPRAGVSPS